MVCTHVNILSVNPITALDAGTKLYLAISVRSNKESHHHHQRSTTNLPTCAIYTMSATYGLLLTSGDHRHMQKRMPYLS